MNDQEQEDSEPTIKELCDGLRLRLLSVERLARGIKGHPEVTSVFDPGEAIAQSMLAVRHIEDARMRLGKVLQYIRDGVSAFDNPAVKTVVDQLPRR